MYEQFRVLHVIIRIEVSSVELSPLVCWGQTLVLSEFVLGSNFQVAHGTRPSPQRPFLVSEGHWCLFSGESRPSFPRSELLTLISAPLPAHQYRKYFRCSHGSFRHLCFSCRTVLIIQQEDLCPPACLVWLMGVSLNKCYVQQQSFLVL